MILTRTIDSYRFGFFLNLTELQLRTLAGLFQHPAQTSGVSMLGGRTAVTLAQLDGIGPVAIKYYRRGGLMRYIIKSRYLKLGQTRSQREFELLHTVGNLGLNVPEPIAYAHRGRLLYRNWLVTRKIYQPESLVRLSLRDENKARKAMESVIEQVAILIKNNIWHVDLHPGNVVVDQKDRVYLLDFDKGRVAQRNITKLRYRYINRWQRAVGKYNLPNMLSEMMQVGLLDLQ